MFYSLRNLLWNPKQGRFLDCVCLTVFFPSQYLSQFIITRLFLFNISCSIVSKIYAWFCFYFGPSLEHIICLWCIIKASLYPRSSRFSSITLWNLWFCVLLLVLWFILSSLFWRVWGLCLDFFVFFFLHVHVQLFQLH